MTPDPTPVTTPAPELSTCPRRDWYNDLGKKLRAAGWQLRKSGEQWDAENALIEKATSPEEYRAVVRLTQQNKELIAIAAARDAEIERLTKERDEARGMLRKAWEAGFALCRRYGDNHVHFEGEQKERQWKRFLEGRRCSIKGCNESGLLLLGPDLQSYCQTHLPIGGQPLPHS